LATDQKWETLEDGRRVLIRPIRPGDVEHNTRFLERLSAPSKHFLFLGGIARLSEEELRKLCAPDQVHDMAYVALASEEAGGEIQVGVARYAANADDGSAEISLAVADDWQHQGLGTRVLERLIAYARAHSVQRLYSVDAANNTRMRKLAERLAFEERPDPEDNHQVIYSLRL
jgi:RimJ/RimL family protein N-acetyltransferase